MGDKLLRYIPAAGYLIAQLIVVGVWVSRIADLGVSEGPSSGELLEVFLRTFLFTAAPALALGIFDGLARVLENPGARAGIAVLFVLLTGFWIVDWLDFAIGIDPFDRDGDAPSLVQYTSGLASIELALILYWVVAVAISKLVDLARTRGRAIE